MPDSRCAGERGIRGRLRQARLHPVGGRRPRLFGLDRPRYRLRRLLSEAIGTGGLTFILTGGATAISRHAGEITVWETSLVLSVVSGVWLTAAIFFLGDISAHFNPVSTLAFALRGDMAWGMAVAYWVVQLVSAVLGSLLAVGLTGAHGTPAATRPPAGLEWQAVGFEAVLTFGLVLLVLNMANGPKLNGPFVPIAVGGYIVTFGTMGGPFDGAAMNPARAFGPDVVALDVTGLWGYFVGPVVGAAAAVGVARVLRGRATAAESAAAEGVPVLRHRDWARPNHVYNDVVFFAAGSTTEVMKEQPCA